MKPFLIADETISKHYLFTLIELLVLRGVWIAPVGNEFALHRMDALRGFMVCRRSINNADGKNTRVDYLRTDATLPVRWKKPFRESECLFTTMNSAIFAAADVVLPPALFDILEPVTPLAAAPPDTPPLLPRDW